MPFSIVDKGIIPKGFMVVKLFSYGSGYGLAAGDADEEEGNEASER
jgi:hypothetical protein